MTSHFSPLVKGSADLYVTVTDIDILGNDLVTVFNVNLATTPGSNFTDTGTLAGTGIDTSLQLKYRVLCLEDYFGPSCTKLCQENDSDEGHYTCDGNGNFVCMEGYSNPSTNCTIGRATTAMESQYHSTFAFPLIVHSRRSGPMWSHSAVSEWRCVQHYWTRSVLV